MTSFNVFSIWPRCWVVVENGESFVDVYKWGFSVVRADSAYPNHSLITYSNCISGILWSVLVFDSIVLFYIDCLNKTRSLFYIKVHELYIGFDELYTTSFHSLSAAELNFDKGKPQQPYNWHISPALQGLQRYDYYNLYSYVIVIFNIELHFKSMSACMLILYIVLTVIFDCSLRLRFDLITPIKEIKSYGIEPI